MKLNNIVLVPTDFSDACSNAADHAIRIAAKIEYKVVLLHVINKDTYTLFPGQKDIYSSVEGKFNQLEEKLRLAEPGVKIEFMYQEGSIFDLIHEIAHEIGANMIILGTHGKKGIQHLVGSYALKVITKALVPTLVVQKKPYSGYQNILLPVNTFTEARQKVGISISIAKRFNSTIHIFKEVVSDPGEMSRLDIIVKQITDAFSKNSINFKLITSKSPGESAKEIIDVAVEKNMDAIIIVTEPQIGSTYFSLGSWNEKILFNEAQIPVMCINPVEYGQVFFDL